MVQPSLETVERMVLGLTPRSSTPRPPTKSEPSQCIIAPVW